MCYSSTRNHRDAETGEGNTLSDLAGKQGHTQVGFWVEREEGVRNLRGRTGLRRLQDLAAGSSTREAAIALEPMGQGGHLQEGLSALGIDEGRSRVPSEGAQKRSGKNGVSGASASAIRVEGKVTVSESDGRDAAGHVEETGA